MGDFDEFLPYKIPRVDKVNPQVLEAFGGLAQEYYETTGEPLVVTDSFRTYEEQVSAHARKPKLALPAGTSRHESGDALDVDQNQIAKLGLETWQDMLGRHGFTLPALSKGETWHIEIPRSIKKAEKIAAKVSVPDDFAEFLPKKEQVVAPENDFAEFITAPKAEGSVDTTFAPTKEQAEASAKASGVEIEPGLVEPTTFNPPMLAGGVAGIARGAGGSLLGMLSRQGAGAALRALPGMAAGEVAAGGTEEALGGAPSYIKIPATMAADVLGGMGTDKLLKRLTAKAPMPAFTNYPAEEIGAASAKLDEVNQWMNQLKEGNWKAYNRLGELTEAGEKSAGFARAATGLEKPSNVLTPEAMQEAEMLKGWLGARGKRLDLLTGERDVLAEQITKLKGKPAKVVEPVVPSGKIGGAEAGAVARSPKELGTPLSDINPQTLGSYNVETKNYQFDRIERALPGAKDSIYWKHKANEKAGFEETEALVDMSRQWEVGLPKGSSRDIMINAIARQKGGPDILKAMGVDDIPTLGPQQEETLKKFYTSFDELFIRLNAARAAAGKDPLDKVDNYFTFFRQLTEAGKNDINPITVNKDWFKPTLTDLDFAKSRVKSDLPLATDAFKVYRNYVRGVVPWIHQAPHLKETMDLANSLEKETPNLAYALRRWAANAQGSDRKIDLGLTDRGLRKVTNNISVATLGGYVRSAMTQPASLIGAGAEIGPKYLAQGIAQSLDPKKVQFALDNSLVLKTREFDVTIVDAIERMVNDSVLGKIKRGATTISYEPLRYMDAKSAQSAWLGAHAKAVSKGMANPIKYADGVVLKTQGSAARSDISDIQTHAIGKALTMFQTFVISDFNYIAKDLLGIGNPNIRKPEQLRKVINYVVGGALLNTAMDEMGLPSVVPSPISDMSREVERPGARGLDVVGAGVKSLAQKIPVVGGHARFGGSILGPLATFGENILEGKESLPTAAMKIAGVPGTTQLQKFLPMLAGDEEVSTDTLKAALFGKTADQYELERGRKELSPEKRFMQGLKEPVNTSLEDLMQLLD